MDHDENMKAFEDQDDTSCSTYSRGQAEIEQEDYFQGSSFQNQFPLVFPSSQWTQTQKNYMHQQIPPWFLSSEYFGGSFEPFKSSTLINTPKKRENKKTNQPLGHSAKNGHHEKQEEPEIDKKFEIDVKPRRRRFNSEEERINFIEDYKKKYKTELCKNFELKGYCKWFDQCSFAHGKHELRAKDHLSINYKEKRCRQYHVQGYCSYGNRCQYLHMKNSYAYLLETLVYKIQVRVKENEERSFEKIMGSIERLAPRLPVFRSISSRITLPLALKQF